MRILVVDKSAEHQTSLARMIEAFDPVDRDSLDLVVSLSSEKDFIGRLSQADILILGAGLEDSAHVLAKQAKDMLPSVEIIMFVSERSYSSGSFRAALGVRVRKVIPTSASSLDLLQELVSIHEQFRCAGKAKKGRLVVITQAKGGIGSTTLAASLGEICSEAKQHTLLWDLDIESRDLSRAVNCQNTQGHIFTGWLHNAKELGRESLREACTTLNNYLSILTVPDDIAARMDLIGHPDSVKIVHRIIELSRVVQDTVIVDTAGKLSPATGTLLRSADQIVVLVDDSLLGLSAAHAYFETLLTLLKGNEGAIRIVCSGTKMHPSEIAKLFGDSLNLPETAWSMPSIPIDSAAERWPGTGKSLFGLGQRATRKAIAGIASRLGVVSEDDFHGYRQSHEGIFGLTPILGKLIYPKASNA